MNTVMPGLQTTGMDNAAFGVPGDQNGFALQNWMAQAFNLYKKSIEAEMQNSSLKHYLFIFS
jgi:hypothetical protein